MYAEIFELLSKLAEEPEQFLRVQPAKCNDVVNIIQRTYKLCTNGDNANKSNIGILQNLMVDDMSEEDIWQQLELRNNLVVSQFIQHTAQLLSLRKTKFEINLKKNGAKDEVQCVELCNMEKIDEFDDKEVDCDGAEELFNAKEENKLKHKRKKQQKCSIVDDKFFKLSEMEEYLEAEEANNDNSGKKRMQDLEEIDYFAVDFGDGNVNDDAAAFNFADFFDTQETKVAKSINNHAEVESSDSRSEGNSENGSVKKPQVSLETNLQDISGKSTLQPSSDTDSNVSMESKGKENLKSSFELREARLQTRIEDFEGDMLGEKPWQLKGEIRSNDRPHNALLEELFEFDATTRPAPIITEQTTQCLDGIIRQRITDHAWDDVELMIRPIHMSQELRKQLVLDQKKSKESLAQIYENEYQRELNKVNLNRTEEIVEEESEAHKKIKNAMNELFFKLDGIFNSNFVPKPVLPEPAIITNTPAIALEEVAPVGISDAALLAPEEIFRGPKNGFLGKTERTKSDKNRERRKKKQKQRTIRNINEIKSLRRQKMGIPLTRKQENTKQLRNVTKHRNVEMLNVGQDRSTLKSSTAFFSKLQDTASTVNVSRKGAKKEKIAIPYISAKKLKL